MPLAPLAQYTAIQADITATIAWFDTLTYSSRDVLIVRIGKYSMMKATDFVDPDTISDEDILRFMLRHVLVPIDFCKVTEYIDNNHYNMYAYKVPYETSTIEVHDTSADQWSYYLPTGKEGDQYVTDLMAGIDGMYTVVGTMDDSPVYSPVLVFLGEFATPPSSPTQNNTYRDSDDSLTYIYTGSEWLKFGYLGEFASAPTSDVYVNNRYLNSGDDLTYEYDGISWIVVSPSLTSKSRTISPLIKNPNTEVKIQYVDTDPKTYAYPRSQGVDGADGMYIDLPEYVLTTMAYIAYKSDFFTYRDDVVHGDVIVFNLDTLCKDANPNHVDYNDNPITVYGMLGELLNSVNTNIVEQGGTP